MLLYSLYTQEASLDANQERFYTLHRKILKLECERGNHSGWMEHLPWFTEM